MPEKTVNTIVSPEGHMEVLSHQEVETLRKSSREGGLYDVFRRCSLAVLNCGNDTRYGKLLTHDYRDFEIRVVQEERGVQLELSNAPAEAFVDGKIIQGIREHLFSVLRDIIHASNEIYQSDRIDLSTSDGVTNAVFHILRNAGLFDPRLTPNLVVCWGGHSIGRTEYDYTKQVGYELGLRGLNICTGCGPGAMKGPMKGAAIGHAKQRIPDGAYIGLTEPGIIAAESPNPIVNALVILPDIEKRLEAFIRTGHAIIVFPGGVGTAEEILFLMGVLMNPANQAAPFPVIFTGDADSAEYFTLIDEFLRDNFGSQATRHYQIVIDDPAKVAHEIKVGLERVRQYRSAIGDSYYFNWSLKIEQDFQSPFNPTHKTMSQLDLSEDRPKHLLAADLRRAFSGIVAGNIKEETVAEIEENGPFSLTGSPTVVKRLDKLLDAFVKQNRMAIVGETYQPCYLFAEK